MAAKIFILLFTGRVVCSPMNKHSSEMEENTLSHSLKSVYSWLKLQVLWFIYRSQGTGAGPSLRANLHSGRDTGLQQQTVYTHFVRIK